MLQALTAPGVFSSGHFIPYIFLEWDYITTAHPANHCHDVKAVVDLLQDSGYSAVNIHPLGVLEPQCLGITPGLVSPARDVVWVHKTANPLWDDVVNYINCVTEYH